MILREDVFPLVAIDEQSEQLVSMYLGGRPVSSPDFVNMLLDSGHRIMAPTLVPAFIESLGRQALPALDIDNPDAPGQFALGSNVVSGVYAVLSRSSVVPDYKPVFEYIHDADLTLFGPESIQTIETDAGLRDLIDEVPGALGMPNSPALRLARFAGAGMMHRVIAGGLRTTPAESPQSLEDAFPDLAQLDVAALRKNDNK